MRRALLVAALVVASIARAQSPDDEFAKKLSNPIADMASIPLQLNWEQAVGPGNQLRFVMNFQPVVPFKLTPKMNLISRFILPYINSPTVSPDSLATSGTGDIVFSLFFSPSTSKVVWGVGPAFNLPTNENSRLGSGEWGIGPTAVVLQQRGPWTYGGLVNHLAGDDLNTTFLQPFLARQFAKAITLSVNTETTYNWEADEGEEWTVPVNVVVSKVTRLGPLPFSVGGGAGYYVDSPTNGPEWKLRAVFTLILPSKKGT